MKAYKANANKIVLGIVIGIVVASFVVGSVPALRWPLFRILWDYAIYRAQQRRVLLLHKSDHQALLEAGREILSQVPKDRLNPQPDGETYLGSFPVPKGIRIPQAIRDLKPHVVVVDYYGYLTLEMHGGIDHFGVRVYPEDFKEPHRNFIYGDSELLPGLWYYDDGYLHNPEYDKRIDGIIQNGKWEEPNQIDRSQSSN
jgi:hypothetical protein